MQQVCLPIGESLTFSSSPSVATLIVKNVVNMVKILLCETLCVEIDR